jgi:nitrate/nitrite transporter NarK
LFVFSPGGPNLVIILIVNTAIASLAIFALSGIYFALLEEEGIPLALTGTVTGIVSVIGFTPDAFMPMIEGTLLDGYPGALGYRYFFLFIALLCIFGLVSAYLILKKYAGKHRKLEIKVSMRNASDK